MSSIWAKGCILITVCVCVCVFIWLDMTTPPWWREKVRVYYYFLKLINWCRLHCWKPSDVHGQDDPKSLISWISNNDVHSHFIAGASLLIGSISLPRYGLLRIPNPSSAYATENWTSSSEKQPRIDGFVKSIQRANKKHRTREVFHMRASAGIKHLLNWDVLHLWTTISYGFAATAAEICFIIQQAGRSSPYIECLELLWTLLNTHNTATAIQRHKLVRSWQDLTTALTWRSRNWRW